MIIFLLAVLQKVRECLASVAIEGFLWGSYKFGLENELEIEFSKKDHFLATIFLNKICTFLSKMKDFDQTKFHK